MCRGSSKAVQASYGAARGPSGHKKGVAKSPNIVHPYCVVVIIARTKKQVASEKSCDTVSAPETLLAHLSLSQPTAIEPQHGRNLLEASRSTNPSRAVSTKTLFDPVDAHVLWRETDNRVEVLLARVREGIDVDAASEWARWLRFTPILQTLPEQDFPLPCRAKALAVKVEALVELCGEWFNKHERARTKPHPAIPRTELEQINAQLLALAKGQEELMRVVRPYVGAGVPALSVLTGGVQ